MTNRFLDWVADHGWVWLTVALILGCAVLVWLSRRADREECEQTGMHDVCQDWASINGALVCMRSEKEPCEP